MVRFHNRNSLELLALLGASLSVVSAFVSPSCPVVRPSFTAISSSSAAQEITDGLFKTVSQSGTFPVKLGDIATVKYSCYLPDKPDVRPFAKSTKQKMVIGDSTMIDGWEKAIRTMAVGERAIIRITDPSLGYGSQGIPSLVPPNSEIELDIEILDSQEPTMNIDFDSLATMDNVPRTASEIAAAYQIRQEAKALEGPEKEGLEGFIEKAKNFYFFGLFEGETGQQAPWYLRPSITFPIAFVVVGATFYVTLAGGGISERGAPVTDELDEIILSSAATNTQVMMTAITTAFMDIMP